MLGGTCRAVGPCLSFRGTTRVVSTTRAPRSDARAVLQQPASVALFYHPLHWEAKVGTHWFEKIQQSPETMFWIPFILPFAACLRCSA